MGCDFICKKRQSIYECINNCQSKSGMCIKSKDLTLFILLQNFGKLTSQDEPGFSCCMCLHSYVCMCMNARMCLLYSFLSLWPMKHLPVIYGWIKHLAIVFHCNGLFVWILLQQYWWRLLRDHLPEINVPSYFHKQK